MLFCSAGDDDDLAIPYDNGSPQTDEHGWPRDTESKHAHISLKGLAEYSETWQQDPSRTSMQIGS